MIFSLCQTDFNSDFNAGKKKHLALLKAVAAAACVPVSAGSGLTSWCSPLSSLKATVKQLLPSQKENGLVVDPKNPEMQMLSTGI